LRLFVALLLAWAGAAWADLTVGPDDLAEIRSLIHRQIEIRGDDVRGACAVYRPANVEFLEVLALGADAVQQVRITDRSGRAWVAYYAVQRQPDGSWRTNGCRMVQPVRTIPT
jgi:hypothetical protein